MIRAELTDVINVGNTLGEGVLWDPTDKTVWWTDIESRCLFRYSLQTRELADFTTPERLCSLALTHTPNEFMCAFESGFGFWSPGPNPIRWIHRIDDHPTVRLNDGRTDRQGRFWCGGLHEAPADGNYQARLWSIDLDGAAQCHRQDIRISNSIATSPDGRTLYFADTPTRRIERYELEPTSGAIGAARNFVVTDADCFPDGSTVDAEGYLWNAQWGGSQVVRYAPDGQYDFILDVPTCQPTCVAFGGDQLSELIVTTARQDLDAAQLQHDTHAGDLLIYRTSVKGLVDTPFGRC